MLHFTVSGDVTPHAVGSQSNVNTSTLHRTTEQFINFTLYFTVTPFKIRFVRLTASAAYDVTPLAAFEGNKIRNGQPQKRALLRVACVHREPNGGRSNETIFVELINNRFFTTFVCLVILFCVAK